MVNTNHTSDDISDLKSSALSHLWMHNRDWVKTGEDGGPDIMVEGNGIRVTDIQGKTWIDVNGGYNSVNPRVRKEKNRRSISRPNASAL
ncbi:MAG: hypothetical protein CM1200mP3_03600 [Chloroflexota bacterium]|nr:MAG: hypothetical protein CM1200mP3_03600 [Chloroflexota bacterium]